MKKNLCQEYPKHRPSGVFLQEGKAPAERAPNIDRLGSQISIPTCPIHEAGRRLK